MYKYESTKELDSEWIDLLLMAKGLGLTPEEIRVFLQKNAKKAQ